MGVTFGALCESAASDGINVAAPTTAVPCRTRRRPTIGQFHLGTADLLSIDSARAPMSTQRLPAQMVCEVIE
jgi:hypothetical protein